ncbi:hypothetical protein [Bradyrhizobium sp. S3.7.6]
MNFLRRHLDAHAASINRFDPNERIHTVGASDVGQCERKVFWSKKLDDNVEPDADYVDTYGAKLRGTMFENHFWAPALKAQLGDRLLFAGEDQQTFFSGYLSATPDGMVTQLDENERALISAMSGVPCGLIGSEVMVECKTYDPRTNLADPKTENVFQTHVQMGLVRELTPYKPTHSILSYTDASWWNEGPEFVIEFDPQIYANAKTRAARIMLAKSAEELAPEGWIGGGKDCEYCPFTQACGVERRRVPDAELKKGMLPEFVAEVTELARAVKQIDAAIDSQSSIMKELQHKLKERLRAEGYRKVPGVVSWSPIAGKTTYDGVAMREALTELGINIEQFAKVGEPSDRFQITLKG